MKTLVPTVSLMVTRDAMTILPTTVPTYEAEVTKAMFGEDNIAVLDVKSEPAEVESDGEADRLTARYGKDAVEKAYGVNYKGAITKAVAEAIKTAMKK